MCGNDRKRDIHGPGVAASLKERAEKVSGTLRIVCVRDGVSTELWLEGGEVRSREAAIRDAAHSSGAAMCKALLERADARLPEMRRADGAGPEVRQVLRFAPGAGAG